jgi:hypothetical protein
MLGTSAASTILTNSIEWNVNTNTLPNGASDHLLLGLDDTLTSGSGFTSLTFILKEDGVNVVDQTFTTVGAANTYFTNDLVDLGAWTSGGTLDLEASLSETLSGTGNGYGINYMLGVDPPVPASTPEPGSPALRGAGLAGLGLAAARCRRGSRVWRRSNRNGLLEIQRKVKALNFRRSHASNG